MAKTSADSDAHDERPHRSNLRRDALKAVNEFAIPARDLRSLAEFTLYNNENQRAAQHVRRPTQVRHYGWQHDTTNKGHGTSSLFTGCSPNYSFSSSPLLWSGLAGKDIPTKPSPSWWLNNVARKPREPAISPILPTTALKPAIP